MNQNKSEMNNKKVSIEIWSDVVCPFCILGKRKIEQAIKSLNAQDTLDVIWRSSLLNPDFPKDTALATIPYLSEHKGYPLSQVQAIK